MLSQTLLGLVSSILGIYFGYLFIHGLDNGASPFFIILSLVLIGAGIYLLMHASNSNATVAANAPSEKSVEEDSIIIKKRGFEGMLKHNNEMSEEWEKVNSQRDKLRTLQFAEDEEKKK